MEQYSEKWTPSLEHSHSAQPAHNAGEEVDEEEASFLKDLYSLLGAAHFQVLSRGDWDAACDNEFTVSLSISPFHVAI